MRVATGATAHRYARYTVSARFCRPSAKSLTATFDVGRLSSDGGLIVLREIAARLGLAQVIAARLRDDRDPTRDIRNQGEIRCERCCVTPTCNGRSTGAQAGKGCCSRVGQQDGAHRLGRAEQERDLPFTSHHRGTRVVERLKKSKRLSNEVAHRPCKRSVLGLQG